MIVLTGGAGFIGSGFLWKLNQAGIKDILVVDNLAATEKWRNLAGKSFIDYIHKDKFLSLIESNKAPKPKKVIHLGACSSTTLQDADYFISNNYEYSKKIALWALRHKASFLYASSAATYGAGEYGYQDDQATTFKLRPLNMYGYSKQLFDLWVYHHKLEKKVTGIKFFNVFGPNEYHKGEMMSLVCKRFREVKATGTMKLFKSYRNDVPAGEQKRDFIYIKDAVEMMYFLFANPAKTGIFNMGTGEARSWNDVARSLFKALGIQGKIEYIDMPEILQEKYQYFTQANMDKLLKQKKYRCRALEDSVKDYAQYLEKNLYL
ncbi:MAG: ADP-glyceromanno-heptose 6-epimerase [bacterium]|nr:ADP-glyceromanno-heptose 6-epimerase [bacterium]